jgi:hypothetical protein
VVDAASGRFITQREIPKLCLVGRSAELATATPAVAAVAAAAHVVPKTVPHSCGASHTASLGPALVSCCPSSVLASSSGIRQQDNVQPACHLCTTPGWVFLHAAARPQVRVELPPEALAVADWGGVSPQAAMTITAPGMDRQLLVRLQAPPLEGALK